MNVQEQLHQALKSERPTPLLSEAVKALLAQGKTRDEILAELEMIRRTLGGQGNETEEDAILEVMDFLTGWCSPHMKI